MFSKLFDAFKRLFRSSKDKEAERREAIELALDIYAGACLLETEISRIQNNHPELPEDTVLGMALVNILESLPPDEREETLARFRQFVSKFDAAEEISDENLRYKTQLNLVKELLTV